MSKKDATLWVASFNTKKRSENTAGVHIGIVVVIGVKAVELHGVCVGGGMDELAVAHIDAHVRDGGGDPAVVEKDQVAGLKLTA